MEKPPKNDGLTPMERIAWRIHNGGTNELLKGVVALDLIVELRRAEAARGFASLLRHKLEKDGYIVVSDIDDSLAQFHYQEADDASAA